MDLRHCRYFIAVAERLSFTDAARHLGIAQPPLSVQIRNLETEVGGALFTRQNRRVVLTAIGHRFLEEARKLVDLADRTITQVQDEAAGREGVMTLAHTDGALSDAITRRLRKFLRKHRGLRVQTVRINPGNPVLADGLITEFTVDAMPDRAITLESAQIQLAIPPKHRLIGRTDLIPADLIGESLVVSPPEARSAAERAFLARCEADGIRLALEAGESFSLRDRFWRVSLGLALTVCTNADRGSLDAHRIPLAEPSPEIVTVFVPDPNSKAAALPLLIKALQG